ncbi:DUF2382 domain-containing protein [Lewinella sp. IMCC34191]|uniref:DUF2382 domain-containing protein n=1 Tax=Lewinella sp. IMCC34191 TaxID=2259172 RepID=UPI00130088EF|nr:DUF2382 domain-containing protein [Lewinella sp. IMCC34191]
MATESDEREDFGNKRFEIEDEQSIPLIKEHVVIDTRSTITSELSVNKTVNNRRVDLPLTDVDTTYREERMPINRVVDTMPTIRYEGENLVVPVVREEEVVVKRLVLVEEIHLIKEVRRTERTESIELRSEEVEINRRTPGQSPT